MFLILLYSFKYIRQISANIHHFVFQFLAISTIFCRKFATYNNQFSILFAHYNDQIYPNLCITLTNFPQSMNNTVFCGIWFQISPNLIYFRNYLQWPKRFPRVSFRGYARNDKRLIHTNSTHEHDNRIIPDYIVGNNQQMLIFANITGK